MGQRGFKGKLQPDLTGALEHGWHRSEAFPSPFCFPYPEQGSRPAVCGARLPLRQLSLARAILPRNEAAEQRSSQYSQPLGGRGPQKGKRAGWDANSYKRHLL